MMHLIDLPLKPASPDRHSELCETGPGNAYAQTSVSDVRARVCVRALVCVCVCAHRECLRVRVRRCMRECDAVTVRMACATQCAPECAPPAVSSLAHSAAEDKYESYT